MSDPQNDAREPESGPTPPPYAPPQYAQNQGTTPAAPYASAPTPYAPPQTSATPSETTSPYAPQPGASSPYAAASTSPQYGATAPQGGAPYGGMPDPSGQFGATAYGSPQGYGPPGGNYAPPPQTKAPGIAIGALVVGIAALVLCWIPFLGVALGIAGVVVGILAMRKPGGKGFGLGGLITGALALLIALVVTSFTLFAINQVNTAVEEFETVGEEAERESGTSDGSGTEDEGGTAAEPTEPAEPTQAPGAGSGALGTREDPALPGVDFVTFTDDSGPLWEITVGTASWDSWPAVQAENQFNEPPAAGNVYVLVPVTATYLGAGTGDAFIDLYLEYVAADGTAYDDSFVVAPMDLSAQDPVATGGTVMGNLVFEVPADAVTGGTWALSVGYDSDTMYFAAQ
ncbi:DUF4190 domain-containing protein [Actinotalea sp. JY-7876]|uniref:DUF4190 domain-containing protein n=1 Tax=Actinotalea sp. JY-7876 TaxID=2758442 RepID=UPI0015F5F5A7|nr:DUF4190 domain-containing protein [Actinotalea sp. JY-7876]